MTAFLDTGYVIALESADDQHHEQAHAHWRHFTKERPQIVTTTYIFDEIVTFFNSRGFHDKAVETGNRLLSSPSVRMVHVDEHLFGQGWQYLAERADKLYSLTDCISFVVMGQYRITAALSFDGHFEQAGFLRLPVLRGS